MLNGWVERREVVGEEIARPPREEGCRTSLQMVQLKRFPTPLFCHNEFVLIADVPGFTADECEKIARAMHDSKNEDFVVLHEINNTISSEDQFSEVRSTELRNHSTDLGRPK